MVRLRLVEETNLAGHLVREDGTDGCRVCFTAREYAIGPNACRLDGALVKIAEVYLPDSMNSSMRMLITAIADTQLRLRWWINEKM